MFSNNQKTWIFIAVSTRKIVQDTNYNAFPCITSNSQKFALEDIISLLRWGKNNLWEKTKQKEIISQKKKIKQTKQTENPTKHLIALSKKRKDSTKTKRSRPEMIDGYVQILLLFQLLCIQNVLQFSWFWGLQAMIDIWIFLASLPETFQLTLQPALRSENNSYTLVYVRENLICFSKSLHHHTWLY